MTLESSPTPIFTWRQSDWQKSRAQSSAHFQAAEQNAIAPSVAEIAAGRGRISEVRRHASFTPGAEAAVALALAAYREREATLARQAFRMSRRAP